MEDKKDSDKKHPAKRLKISTTSSSSSSSNVPLLGNDTLDLILSHLSWHDLLAPRAVSKAFQHATNRILSKRAQESIASLSSSNPKTLKLDFLLPTTVTISVQRGWSQDLQDWDSLIRYNMNKGKLLEFANEHSKQNLPFILRKHGQFEGTDFLEGIGGAGLSHSRRVALEQNLSRSKALKLLQNGFQKHVESPHKRKYDPRKAIYRFTDRSFESLNRLREEEAKDILAIKNLALALVLSTTTTAIDMSRSVIREKPIPSRREELKDIVLVLRLTTTCGGGGGNDDSASMPVEIRLHSTNRKLLLPVVPRWIELPAQL